MKNLVTVGVLLVAALTIAAVAAEFRCPSIANCITCTSDPRICTKCANLHAIDENGKCKACNSMDGCSKCNSTKKCDRCRYSSKDGPDFNGRGTCSACAANCRSCSISGSGNCDTCKPGYFVDSDKSCSSCPSNCQFCTLSALNSLACKECQPGYSKADGSSRCFACAANCESCAQIGANKCNKCNAGYIVNVDKQCTRLPCGANCAVCVNDKCQACKDRNFPIGGTCECAQNCASCQKAKFGKCDRCKFGYNLTSDNKCIRAPNRDGGFDISA